MNESISPSVSGNPPRSQITLLIVGALIGFVPGFVTTIYQVHTQAAMQKKQFLLDRRITAIKDFASALNGIVGHPAQTRLPNSV